MNCTYPMNLYCCRLFSKLCLDFYNGLTADQKKEFLFYFRNNVPAGILDNCKDDFLKALTELQQRHILLFENTSFLNDFLKDIKRFDLLSKVESFVVSRELIWLFEALITSRTGKKLCEGKFDIENGCEGRSLIDIFVKHQEIFKLSMDTNQIGENEDIDTQLVNFREKSVQQSKAKRMTWELIPLLIRFAVECAVSCYSVDRVIEWEKIVVDICSQLVDDLVPWITKNGGWKEFEAFISKECKIGERIESDGRDEDYCIVVPGKEQDQSVLGICGAFITGFLTCLILTN